MSALSDYLRKPKPTLARSLSSRDRELEQRDRALAEQSARTSKVTQVASRTAGATLTAPAAAGLLGFIETRFPDKDGSPASVGPIPLSGAAGLAFSAVSLGLHDKSIAADQAAFAAAGCLGLAAGSMARNVGVKHRAAALAKKGKKKGKKKLPAAQPPRSVAGYGMDDEDIPVVAGSDVGHLEDEWSPEERELLGFA